MNRPTPFRAVAVGCSAGGLEALRHLLAPLAPDFPLPIVVVCHLSPDGPSLLTELLAAVCRLAVVEAEDKMKAEPGRIHVAPPGYHLLAEEDETFSLSVDEKVCNVRPSIDVLFEAAADVWAEGLVGVLLTGANSDGTAGLRAIKRQGGYCLVQDPQRAFADTMPRSAIEAGLADCVLPVEEMAARLQELAPSRPARRAG